MLTFAMAVAATLPFAVALATSLTAGQHQCLPRHLQPPWTTPCGQRKRYADNELGIVAASPLCIEGPTLKPIENMQDCRATDLLLRANHIFVRRPLYQGGPPVAAMAAYHCA